MGMRCFVVAEDGAAAQECRLDELEGHRDGHFAWIDLRDGDAEEIHQLQGMLGVHELAVEDVIDAGQRPKVERYGSDVTFVALRPAVYDRSGPGLRCTELHVIVGPDYVVTVDHGDDDVVERVRHGAGAAPRRAPAAVLHAVVDRVVDGYLEAIADIEDDVQAIEGRVFSRDGVCDLAPQIYDLKRVVLDLWHDAEPLVVPLQGIVAHLDDEGDPLSPYFRDVLDHLRLVVARLDQMRDLLTDALDANIARLSVRQNEDMRKMSAWGALFLLPTVLVGVWGMNFEHMPELDERWGYPFAIAVIVGSCSLLYWRLRRSGWL